MKKKTALIGLSTLGLGVLSYHKLKAHRQGRSLRSLVVNDIVRHTPQKSLETLRAGTEEKYRLPKIARYRYGFKPLKHDPESLEYTPKNYTAENIIFYIHGGAYWYQPAILNFRFLHRFAKQAQARIIMPIYPKAPHAEALDVHAMILKRYRDLIEEQGISPKTITFMGDSAGAGFLMSMMQVLRDSELPQPQQALLMSPWLDVSNSNPEMANLEVKDVLLDLETLRHQGEVYAGSLSVKDPLVSPIYGDSTNLAPITIFTGTHDILHPDALKLEHLARLNHWDITLHIYDKMMHSFIQFPTPEAKAAIKTMHAIMKNKKSR